MHWELTDVMDDDVRPADVAADLLHSRQDLLVDGVLPAELRMIGEEPDVGQFGSVAVGHAAGGEFVDDDDLVFINQVMRSRWKR